MPSVVNDSGYATGIGLVLYGQQMQNVQHPREQLKKPSVNFNQVFVRVKKWFQGNF